MKTARKDFRGTLWRLGRLTGLTACGGYLLLAVSLYLRQAELVFPGAATRGTDAARFEAPSGSELVELRTRTGEKFAVLFGAALDPFGNPALKPKECPTLLVFYGNGMCLADSLRMFERFRKLGAHAVVVEYPGYGLSTGRPGETSCYRAADAALTYLQQRSEVDPRRIVAVGRSLGGGVAIDLAARRPLAGVITLSTFTSLVDVAAPRFPQFPVAALLRHRFESRAKIGRVRCPLLLIHGTEDEVVPFAMRDRLAGAAAGPVTRLDVPGAGHNNLFTVDGERVLRAMREFLGRI